MKNHKLSTSHDNSPWRTQMVKGSQLKCLYCGCQGEYWCEWAGAREWERSRGSDAPIQLESIPTAFLGLYHPCAMILQATRQSDPEYPHTYQIAATRHIIPPNERLLRTITQLLDQSVGVRRVAQSRQIFAPVLTRRARLLAGTLWCYIWSTLFSVASSPVTPIDSFH